MPGFFPHETVRPVQSNFMEEVKRALHEKKHLIAHCPTGVGKCVSKDTLILTEKGLKPISELYGKPVFVNGLNSSLKMSLAKGLVIRKRKSQLYDVTTNIGRAVSTTEDHKFLSIQKGMPVWKELKYLEINDYIALPRILRIEEKEPVLRIEEMDNYEDVYVISPNIPPLIKN